MRIVIPMVSLNTFANLARTPKAVKFSPIRHPMDGDSSKKKSKSKNFSIAEDQQLIYLSFISDFLDYSFILYFRNCERSSRRCADKSHDQHIDPTDPVNLVF